MGKKGQKNQEELLKTLGDFTSKENWDKFFSIRGADDSFEWYAEWPLLKKPLLSHLSLSLPEDAAASSEALRPPAAGSEMQILVPGCGNSRLSEQLYDAGFRNITNIDFSKVVISDMLRRNVRSRPEMRWRVMDMTSMQLGDESFDIVLDKGGLDALMEPELGPKLGNQYLSEVKRVLKTGGKFICLTLAESHVLGLLFPKFRYGWKLSLHAIPQKHSTKPSLQTFMVIAEKETSTVLYQISSAFSHSSLESSNDQVRGLCQAFDRENNIRLEFSNGYDILYSLEDLKLGAKGNMVELSPGRRVQLTLGEPGFSKFSYRAVLLDAREQSGSFLYKCGVFLVPKTRSHEWLFSSEEGQWLVVESSKAARLIMVLLDSTQANASMDDIQKDLSPLVKQLAPGGNDVEAQIPYMAASDGIKQRNIVHQAMSALTGSITIDDVVYEEVDDNLSHLFHSKELIFRRLTFQRTENLVQSEALLAKELEKTMGEVEQRKSQSSSKSRKRGNHKRFDSHASQSNGLNDKLIIDHNYLASSYHIGIISGFRLIAAHMEKVASAGGMVKAIVIGLGAGLLPMFLRRCLPFLHIEVVELDPVVSDLAVDYFGFKEDEHLKVHITDGIQFVGESLNIKEPVGELSRHGHQNDHSSVKPTSANGSCTLSREGGKRSNKIDILIVDVDSSDSSSGMTCPAADFVEESFLVTVNQALSEHGLFVINLVSRSPTIKDMVFSRMKVVFNNLFCLQLEEDVNEVVFALNSEVCIQEEHFTESCHQLERLLKLKYPKLSQSILDSAKKIKCLS